MAEPIKSERKGSIIMADEGKRKASIAAMTENTTGECVSYLPSAAHY